MNLPRGTGQPEEIRSRIAAQLPRGKLKYADRIIDNSGEPRNYKAGGPALGNLLKTFPGEEGI